MNTQAPITLTPGQRVDYIFSQPLGALAPDILTGTVTAVGTTKHGTPEYFIVPDDARKMGRWRLNMHIIAVGEVVNTQAA